MTPLELMQWSEGLADLYTGLETDLIANIAAYLAKGSADSSTAQWKLQMLAQMGALNRRNLQTILSYSDIITEEMQATLETAALAAIEELEPGFRQLAREGFINDTDIPVDVTTAAALKAYRKQAQDALNMVNTVMQYKAKAAARRLINDTAELADKPEFLAMLNKAAGSMVTGAESRQAALRRCIHQMTEKGIPAFVDKLGREWTPEAYINMDLRTTMSNVAHQVQFDRMDAYDLTLLEVSSHAGARPKCAKDQGKIFNRNGSGGYTTDLHGRKIRYYAWKDSSYGEPDGLLGINCWHHVYPFTPGIDVQRYFPYDEKENDALYQKMQHQRELERRVRRSKRECMMLETTGDTEGFAKASVTLKQREQALKQYCADEGLDYKNDRTAVVGYGRSTAAKASAAAKRKLAEQTRKRLDKSAESGIIEAEDVKPMIRAIEQPIEQQHTGKGNPNAILTFDVPLNNRQSAILAQLVDYNSRVTVPKKDVNMADLAAFTAKTGHEFAMFTKGQERLIVRGNGVRVEIDLEQATELAAAGYRWSGHTHPGETIGCLMPSPGDKAVLAAFKQDTSVIYNSKGQFATFEKEG